MSDKTTLEKKSGCINWKSDRLTISMFVRKSTNQNSRKVRIKR